MKVPVRDMNGREVSEVELPADIFEAPINVGLMHQAFVRQRANARLGTHKTKTVSEVKRTTAKWYRQKGTGRARHGSRKVNIFVGGAVAHGPRPRKYTKKMPKKMRRAAIRSALSAKAAEDAIVVVDRLEMDAPKTREMVAALGALVGDSSALVLLANRNIPDARYLRANYLNIRDLLKFEKIVMPLDALEVIVGWLGEAAGGQHA
jgi:large subunit ribosomal protein L4